MVESMDVHAYRGEFLREGRPLHPSPTPRVTMVTFPHASLEEYGSQLMLMLRELHFGIRQWEFPMEFLH